MGMEMLGWGAHVNEDEYNTCLKRVHSGHILHFRIANAKKASPNVQLTWKTVDMDTDSVVDSTGVDTVLGLSAPNTAKTADREYIAHTGATTAGWTLRRAFDAIFKWVTIICSLSLDVPTIISNQVDFCLNIR